MALLPALGFSLFVSLLQSTGVYTQSLTNATCMPGTEWMFNSRGQSPCVMGAYLQRACTNGQTFVAALPPGFHYDGPSPESVTPCLCSTVTYSMMAACGACQNATWATWSVWSENCTASEAPPSINNFPFDIPPQTAVPAWAYLDTVARDSWSKTDCRAFVDSPNPANHVESTAVGRAPMTETSAPLATPPPATNTPPPATSSSPQSNTAAIVGGTVGGVVGVALVCVLAWYLGYRQRKAHTAGMMPNMVYSNLPNSPGVMSYHPPTSPPPAQPASPGLNVNLPSYNQSVTHGYQPYLASPDHPASPKGYSGAPEI